MTGPGKSEGLLKFYQLALSHCHIGDGTTLRKIEKSRGGSYGRFANVLPVITASQLFLLRRAVTLLCCMSTAMSQVYEISTY